jgi:8-oxo-dGTP pyrophosphatase MutT (NUDIX family)
MALPGGAVHSGESLEACARRELAEEIGLEADRVETLGLLDDFETVSGFAITPVVMWSSARASELRPSSDEVAHLIIVPLADLRRAVSEAHPGESDRFSLRLTEVEVYAPTAAMLYQFSEVALSGREARVGAFFQPPWTHR